MATQPAKVFSAELEGIAATLVEVEADINVGLHSFNIVGLADKAVSEAKERVNSALKNSGIKPPTRENRRIVVNLAPADVKKVGSQFDLAIAVAYLVASEQIKPFDAADKIFVGELSLNGGVRGVSGALAFTELAEQKEAGFLFVPAENAQEAALKCGGAQIVAVESLTHLIEMLEGRAPLRVHKPPTFEFKHPETAASRWDEIRGQEAAKRAVLVAAAGGHNILLSGPPGAGKTLLAQTLREIMPPLSREETIEVTRIWSAAGMLRERADFVKERPFRSPHHSASLIALIGGGGTPRPGEISLAHRGVLFLDELPEFHRDALEAFRQPLEHKTITINRARGMLALPANFMLAAAMNPCPCGYFGDLEKECRCTANEVFRYKKKISGPLIDRIDIQISVPRVKTEDLFGGQAGHEGIGLPEARRLTQKSRETQKRRFERCGWPGVYANADLSSRQIEQTVQLDGEAETLLKEMLKKSFVSARGYYRILKIGRTIADLDGAEKTGGRHLSEAFQYRTRMNE